MSAETSPVAGRTGLEVAFNCGAFCFLGGHKSQTAIATLWGLLQPSPLICFDFLKLARSLSLSRSLTLKAEAV